MCGHVLTSPVRISACIQSHVIFSSYSQLRMKLSHLQNTSKENGTKSRSDDGHAEDLDAAQEATEATTSTSPSGGDSLSEKQARLIGNIMCGFLE